MAFVCQSAQHFQAIRVLHADQRCEYWRAFRLPRGAANLTCRSPAGGRNGQAVAENKGDSYALSTLSCGRMTNIQNMPFEAWCRSRTAHGPALVEPSPGTIAPTRAFCSKWLSDEHFRDIIRTTNDLLRTETIRERHCLLTPRPPHCSPFFVYTCRRKGRSARLFHSECKQNPRPESPEKSLTHPRKIRDRAPH
jgi:hypothetical protein